MGGETSSALLQDLLSTTKDGDWGKDSPDAGYVAYRVIRGTDFPNVRTGDKSSVPLRYLKQATALRRALEPDDILIETAGGSRDRPTGRSLFISRKTLKMFDLPVTCASFSRFLRVDRKKAEPLYVYWYLQYLYEKGDMAAHQVQHTGVARFQYTNFAGSLRVPLPPVLEQRAIAQILSAFDEKIKLNRQIIKTSEAITQTLFKSWFVDFGPVRAKSEGRDTGLPKYLADLFPDSFEESEGGEIPQEWKMKALGQVTAYLNRGIAPVYLNSGGVLVLNQKCIRAGRVDMNKGRRHDSTKKSIEGRTLQPGDVLVNSTGVGTLGRVAQILQFDEDAVVDGHVTVVRANATDVTWNYLGIELGRREKEIEALGEGSTGQTELSRSRLATLQLVVPSNNVMKAFDDRCVPLRHRIGANEKESRTLAELRDTLLPKLLSGELRIKDAERIVGRVA